MAGAGLGAEGAEPCPHPGRDGPGVETTSQTYARWVKRPSVQW